MAISDHIAVMNEGKIVQVGTAEDLYLQPNSSFVARFIGKINPLPAEVQEVTEDCVLLKVLNQTFSTAYRSRGLRPGQKLHVFVRPESVELTADSRKGQIKGKILEKTFLGEKVDYVMDIDGHLLNATSYDPLRHGTLSLQQEVGVRLGENSLQILQEEGQEK